MKVLLIEDDPGVSRFIRQGLDENQFEVEIAYDGNLGLKMALSDTHFDIIILDVNLPYKSGLEVCSTLRAEGVDTPVIMLTALDSIDDKVNGLDSGADDYLAKPFDFKELMARIRALTRRQVQTQFGDTLRFENLTVNLSSREVKRDDKLISLTKKEFALLEFLLRNKGKVISREELTEKVWNINFNTSTNVVDVYINYLRKKIDKEFEPKLIHTMFGMGYVLKSES